MKLSSKLGDTKTFRIPLRWGNAAFSPAANYDLTFTLKSDEDDADSAAIIQKATGGLGIVIDESFAVLSILRSDTYREADFPDPGDPAYEATAGTYYWDIQADGLGDFEGDCKTVASGTYSISRDITRATGPSVPIYTTDPPHPSSVTNATVNAAIAVDPEASREALEIPIDNFAAVTAPTVSDDSGDGYSEGSKWYDTVGEEAYLCVNATNGAAVWIKTTLTADELGSAAFTASTDYATAAQGALADSALQPGDLATVATTGAYADLSGKPTLGNSAALNVGTTAGTVAAGDDARLTDARTPTAHASSHVTGGTDKIRDASAAQDGLMTTAFAAKINGIEAGADVTDATNVNAAGAVMESDYSPAHSILVQQSGTGSPSSLSIGNNTLVGRLSGGGSDIDDLSASQVRTLLNVEDGADVTDAANVASSITGAAAKTTPVDSDEFPITDSAASFVLKKLTWANLKATLKTYLDTLYVALTGNQTVAGNKTFSGQTELTGQAATNSTSAMTRLLAMKEPFYAVANIRRPVSPPSFGNSGTAGISAVAVAGDRWNLASGTANSGWARMTFARGINGSPPLSGAGINFSKKIGVSIVAVIGLSVFTDNLNIFRLLVGSNQTPALDGVDATSYRSFGVEFKARGSSYDWRVYGHDGTSITYSAWTNSGLTAAEPVVAVIMIAVESDGVGNITAYLGYNGTRTLSTISTTGGPTTSGISTQAYIDAHVANSSSGTTTLPAAVYDAVLYFE
jgi:hypothetical protein